MERTQPEDGAHEYLPGRSDMLNHRGDIGFEFTEKLCYLVQASVQFIKTGPQSGSFRRQYYSACRRRTAIEYRLQSLRIPSQSGRQRFQGARATPALDGMTLDFPDDGKRDVRAARQLALTPAKLTHAVVNGTRDRTPVFRHAFLRAPSPLARLAGRT